MMPPIAPLRAAAIGRQLALPPAGQLAAPNPGAAAPAGPNPWVVLGVVFVGLVGFEALRASLRRR